MVVLATAPKNSLQQSSFFAVARSLLELLTSLQDTRAILLGSSDPDLSLVSVCPELFKLGVEGVCKHEATSRYPSHGSEINSSFPSSLPYPKGGENSLMLKEAEERENYDNVESRARHTCFILHSSCKSRLSCCLNLQNLLAKTAQSDCIDEARGLAILGVGDRFNVLLVAKVITIGEEKMTQEKRVILEWVFSPDIVAAVCTEIQEQLQETPETLAAFGQALAGWSAKPNLPAIQSELTLHLGAALDTKVRDRGCRGGLSKQPFGKTDSLSTKPALFGEAGEICSATRHLCPPWQQQQWCQQEKLLAELLRINRSTQSTSAILQQSASLIRETFGVSRCAIAFYNAKQHRLTWGAIAHAPQIPVSARQTQYPDWQAVEQSIQSTHRANPWATEPNPGKIGSLAAQSVFFTWLPPSPDCTGVSCDNQTCLYGLLVVEQWEGNRGGQTNSMQLLNLALQQVQQNLEAALLYQQAEERAQYAALINRLVDQIRASLELPQIFETVTRELGHLLVADRCGILQYLEKEKVWQRVTEYRAHPDTPAAINLIIPEENNPVISQLHDLQIVEVSDTRTLEDPLNKSLAEKYPGSWLMVPIHRQGKIWGCLSFAQDNYPRYWHQSELNFLTTVADQLAIAIYQATLYQQIQQQNQILESLVQERTRELESFFDAHPDYIFVVEHKSDEVQQPELRLRFCNNAFAKIMGFENQQQVKGQSIVESFPSLAAKSFVKQNSLVFESGQTLHEQETLVLADGIHHFDAFRVPLKRDNGEVYACLGTSRDITELIQTKQALSERTEQLQAALSAAHAASQAKSQFLASMSHELRTPLTAVIGMSSALLKQCFGKLNPKQTEYVQIIHDSGKHLLQLINDILDLSKIEAGKASLALSQFSLREVAGSSLALLRQKAEAQQIQLVSDLSGLPACDDFYGDERRVKQILLNLLSNAVKFTPAGGEVRLCVQYDGQIAKIEVADTGIGIPAEKQHLLFEAFEQIDSALNRMHEGTGLGLALTRQLVEMHGGTIEFHSTIGVGTVFTVHLQAQPPADELGNQQEETTSHCLGGGVMSVEC